MKEKLCTDDETIIDFITELTKEEIRLTTKLDYEDDFIKEEFGGIDMGFRKLTYSFKKKKISLNRKGRIEFIDVMKADNPDNKRKGFWNNFMGNR